MLKAAETPDELVEFFQTIFGDIDGYVYIAFKNPKLQQANWRQEFIKWPEDQSKLVAKVIANTSKAEVYYGPALYREPTTATKPNILGTQYYWAEFDGTVPDELGNVPEPTVRIQSSSDKHQHWYWRADEFVGDISSIERINRSITYALGADISGWDATQVLRPPGTRNHKRNATVQLLGFSESRYSTGDFSGLPEPTVLVDEPLPDNIPDVNEVIFKYKFKSKVQTLFAKGPKDGDRSDGLMTLGYYLAEMQMKNEEIFCLLLNADTRWGKFAGRNDQVQKLQSIVTIARAKYPKVVEEISVERFKTYGLVDLMSTEVELTWVWEWLLQEAGYMLLTGPSGIGKTQFSLSFAQHLVLGQPYLGRTVTEGKRVGFLSLEMGLVDLKYFLGHQTKGIPAEKMSQFQEFLRILPLGESLYLSKGSEQDAIEDWIHEEKLDGLIIDSLGSATEGELDAVEAKAIMDWVDRVRQRHNCFVWIIHHHRKATGDNKKPNKLSDIYGSQYITARATTVLTLWETAVKDAISVLPLKLRLSKKPDPFYIKRDQHLHFSLSQNQVAIKKAVEKDAIASGDTISNSEFGAEPKQPGLSFE